MRIATFFQPVKDSENLDIETTITVPDQSLSVRDILQRFTRGQIVLPQLDTGVDDDIDDDVLQFDDVVEAMDSIEYVKNTLKNKNLKNNVATEPDPKETEQSEVTDGSGE